MRFFICMNMFRSATYTYLCECLRFFISGATALLDALLDSQSFNVLTDCVLRIHFADV